MYLKSSACVLACKQSGKKKNILVVINLHSYVQDTDTRKFNRHNITGTRFCNIKSR